MSDFTAPDLATLPPMDVPARVGRVRRALAGAGEGAPAEAILLTKLVNIRWLTGFTGSAGTALVRDDRVVLVTDGRYEEQAAEQVAAAGLDGAVEIAIGRTVEAQTDLLRAATAGVGRLALEAHAVTWGEQRRLADALAPELVPSDALVDRLRIEKDDGEIARIEAAAAIATAALASVGGRLWEGPTEAEFGLALDTEMRRLGASGPSFETIVASGPNSAKPHHRPSGRRVEAGDLVVLDFGAKVDGYCSDMTRTVQVGEASSTQARMYEVVLAAQQAGVDAVAAGVEVAAVDRACRSVIEDAGWGEAFLHATGHGVGLEIHEWPRVAATGDATLAPGHVVTVEPGVYLPEHGGVRIEDTVVVLAAGCRPLTRTAKLAAP